MKSTAAENTPRFDHGARLVLGAAFVLVALSVVQIAYRATLPTEGWAVYTTEVEQADWVYYANLVGAPSDIQADDVLIAVDGLPVSGTATSSPMNPPPNWRAGREVQMTIRRGEQELGVSAPVVNWTAAALWDYNLGEFEKAINNLGALVLLATGWFTFLRRPGVPSSRALLLLCSAIGSASISGLIPDGLSVQFDRLAFLSTAFFSYIIFGTLLAPSLLAFTLLFPRPKQVIQQHPWLVYLPFAYGVFLLLFFATGGAGIVGWVSTMAMFIGSIASIAHSGLTQRDSVSRAQLRWAIGGFVAGLGLALLTFPAAFGWVSNPLLARLMGSGVSLGFTVIGVCLAIAVLRYRLFDIDIIIRRTLVYGVLTLTLALAYFGGVVLLDSLFRTMSDQRSPIAIVISTLAIAALFNPLRTRLQGFIDRRFYRAKYNAEKALASFATAARGELDLDELNAELLVVVKETMKPAHASLWMKSRPAKPGGIRGEQQERIE